MTQLPGAILHNRYRIVKQLGQGGFGTMYRVWDTVLGRACALKENLDPAEEIQRQFLREAKILANLTHPNLPRVTDYFIEGAGQYLVMDYVEGRDLQEMLEDRGGPLPEDDAVAWVRQICDALTYLHGQKPPVIHRDVKPGNIKITPGNQAVLVDFGIAKVLDPGSKTTMGAQAVSPGYSPYEQYGKGATDARSDVYALGATLYTLLTAAEPPESVQRMTRDPLVLARQLNPNISVRIGSAVMRALQMDPTHRFQSAADFKAALNPPARVTPPVRSSAQPAARPPAVVAAPPLPRKLSGLSSTTLAAAALVLIALLVLAVSSAWPERGVDAPVLTGGPPGTEGAALEESEPPPTRSRTPTRTRPVVPTPTPLDYTVQVGDTCSEIAAYYDISVSVIADYNRLPPDCGTIYAGQRLLIPQIAGMSPFTPTPKYTATPFRPISTNVAEVDGMVLVYVPAGEFWMGATEIDPEASPAERPPHKVSLRAFWIDRTEVTNEMYSRCVGEGACRPPETESSATRPAYYGAPAFAGYPVIYVAWEDARDYCEWAERRLPTEAEWEKASRGTRVRLYPWGSQPPDATRANYNSRVGDTQPANAYPDGASAYGALNMSGNVAEWVVDWFGDGYYSVSTFANPTGPETGEFRVIRGGSWYNLGRAMRSAFRLWNYPDLRSDTVGFRCAR